MKHSHPDGAKPEEVFAYAREQLMGGPELIEISKQGVTGGEVWAVYERGGEAVRAEICFTRDRGKWQERKWETAAAVVDRKRRRVSAQAPAGITVYFLNVYDAAGLIVSTEHVEAVR